MICDFVVTCYCISDAMKIFYTGINLPFYKTVLVDKHFVSIRKSIPYRALYFFHCFLLQQYLVDQHCNLGTRNYGIKIAAENIAAFQKQSHMSDSSSTLVLSARSTTPVVSHESSESSGFVADLKCKSHFAGQVVISSCHSKYLLFVSLSEFFVLNFEFAPISCIV